MATEEFKLVTAELLKDYLVLRQTMKDKGFENIKFSFKEYLDHYIEYVKVQQEDFDLDDEELLEDDDESYTRDDIEEPHPSHKE